MKTEDWNFATWIAALHAALQTATMGGAAYASRMGSLGTAGILGAFDTFLTFPFVSAWRGVGFDTYDAWFFVPRVPAAILWGATVAWIRAKKQKKLEPGPL